MEPEHDRQASELLLRQARDVCVSMLDGQVTPYEGARQIAAMCRNAGFHPPVLLHTFVYADSEWDERPDNGNIFAEGVVAAARELAAAKLD